MFVKVKSWKEIRETLNHHDEHLKEGVLFTYDMLNRCGEIIDVNLWDVYGDGSWYTLKQGEADESGPDNRNWCLDWIDLTDEQIEELSIQALNDLNYGPDETNFIN